MRALLWGWTSWGLEAVAVIQATSSAPLDLAMRLITLGGDEYLFLLLIPALYWGVHREGTARIALFYLASAWVNVLLKEAAAIPRPFELSAVIEAKVSASGYAFPSGHAQAAAAFWPALAHLAGRPWATWLAAVLVPLVAFSRVYLGVHYPQDALAGIAVGLALYLLYRRAHPTIERWLAARGLGLQLALVIVLPLALGALVPNRDGLAASGAVVGVGIGHALSVHAGPYRPTEGRRAWLLRLVVGLALVAATFAVLSLLPEPSSLPLLAAARRVVRYAGVGLTATLLVPWVYGRLALVAPSR